MGAQSSLRANFAESPDSETSEATDPDMPALTQNSDNDKNEQEGVVTH